MYKTIIFAFAFMLLSVVGCSSAPLDATKVQELFLNHMVNKSAPSKFIWEKLVQLKNFKILKEEQTSPDTYVVEFSFDRIFRVNSADIEKQFPAEDLDAVFGPNKQHVLEELSKKNLQAGQKDATPHLQMILEKSEGIWTVKEVGLPK